MKLQIQFDDDSLREYAQRNASLFFYIAFVNTGSSFPQRGWMDFGCVILSWWLDAALRLSTGSVVEELCFMDGPYTLTARRSGTAIDIANTEGPDFTAQVELHDLCAEFIAAARQTLAHLATLGISGRDVVGLQASLERLALPEP